MEIPLKRSAIKPKYNFSKLMKHGWVHFVVEKKVANVIRANALAFAKKNGIKITSRLQDRGITIYKVEE